MNLYVTHSDKNFVEMAERLFDSLKINSQYRIIYYTVNFDYTGSYDNVICVRVNYQPLEECKKEDIPANMLFFKSKICKEVLSYGMHNYCYLDADCLALADCDDIFLSADKIGVHPLLGRNVYDWMHEDMPDGTLRGNTWLNNAFDVRGCLEADIFSLLGIDINKRTQYYRQSNIILFNQNCLEFISRWDDLTDEPVIRGNQQKYAPLCDETLINTLLWKEDCDENLGFISINIPSNIGGTYSPDPRVQLFVDKFNQPQEDRCCVSEFCEIPPKLEISNTKFIHGKTTASQYDILKRGIITTWNHRKFYSRKQLFSEIGKRFPSGTGVEVCGGRGAGTNDILSSWSGSLFTTDTWDVSGYQAMLESASKFGDRVVFIRATPEKASRMFQDESLDFVYINGYQSYESATDILNCWFPKVKTGGYICGFGYLAIDWDSDPLFADANRKNKHIWSDGRYLGVFGVNPVIDDFCAANAFTKKVTAEWFGNWYIKKS